MKPRDIATGLLGEQGEYLAELRSRTYIRREAIDSTEVLTWVEFERLVNETGVRRTLFCDGNRIENPDPSDLISGITAGATLQLQHVEGFSARISGILGELSAFLGGELTNSNIYLAPSRNHAAFPIHHDTVDTIVIQVSGSKRWTIWNPILKNPIWVMRNHLYDVDEESPLLDVVLKPGDVLYLKRGDPHRVQCAGEEASLHVNLRIEPTTGSDVFEWLIQGALENERNRTSMSVGIGGGIEGGAAWFDGLVDSLRKYCEDVGSDAYQRFLVDRIAAASIPQAVSFEAILPNRRKINHETRVSLASPILRGMLSEHGLIAHGQLIEMPAQLIKVIGYVFAHPSSVWTVRQLAEQTEAREDDVIELVEALSFRQILRTH